jgi:tetratricopeptide (TPR) repeat protein
MKGILTLLWKKSPVKILLFVLLLLAGLGHFEFAANRLRDEVIRIRIDSQPDLSGDTVPAETEQEIFYSVVSGSADNGWTSRLTTTDLPQLSSEWEAWKSEHPAEAQSEDSRLFEVALRIREGNYESAAVLLEEMKSLGEAGASIYLYSGILASLQGRSLDAISFYQQALSARPWFYEAAFNLGVLFYNLNNFTEAVDYLTVAVDYAGGLRRAAAYRVLGKSLAGLERFADARRALEESILLEPASIEARLALAELLGLHMDEPEAAREVYREVLKLEKNTAEVYLGLAKLETAEGDPGQAIQILSEALPLMPDGDSLRMELAKIYITIEEYQLAETQIQVLLESPGDISNALFQRGRIHYQRRKYSQAEADFRAAFEESAESFVEALNNLGLTLAAQENWEAAAEVYKKAIALEPWYDTAFYNLGLAELNLEEFRRAGEAFEQALAIRPDFQEAWFNLGVVEGQLGNFEPSIEAYSQALRLDPKDIKARLNLAVQLRRRGDEARALEQYRLVLELNPDYASAWFNIGLLYKRAGNLRQAEQAYLKAIELEPGQEAYWTNLSALLAGQKKIPEAIETLQQALEIHPESFTLRLNLALQYEKQGEVQAAFEEYTNAVTLNPAYQKGWRYLADLLSDRNQHTEALAAYQKALELRTEDDPYLDYKLGKEFYQVGEYRAAVEHLETALEEIRDNGFIWYNAGKAYQALGNQGKAEEYYGRALALDPGLGRYLQSRLSLLDESDTIFRRKMEEEPDNPVWPIQLSELLHRQGETAEALDILAAAIERFPGEVSIHIVLAKLNAELEDWRVAEKHFEQALNLQPGNPELAWEVARIYLEQEKYAEAEEKLLFAVERLQYPVRALRDLGEIYYKEKRYEEAIAVLTRAVALSPAYGPSWIDLGKAYYRAGQYEEALAPFAKGVELMPEYGWARVWQGRAYRKLEEFENAEEQFMQAVSIEEGFVQGFVALGDLYREMSLDFKALSSYEKALDLDPLDGAIRRRIASVGN